MGDAPWMEHFKGLEMSDQEQRSEEHEARLGPKRGYQLKRIRTYRTPGRPPKRTPLTRCEQCDEMLPTQNVQIDFYDTGWDVCEFCIEKLPDYIWEIIERKDKKIAILEAQL